MKSPGIIEHLVLFARELRARGVFVGMSDEVDGAEALTFIDLLDRGEVCRALRMAFKIQRRDWTTFEELFRQWWAGSSTVRACTKKRRPAFDRGHRVPGQRQSPQPRLVAVDGERHTGDGEQPGSSSEMLLRRKPFEEWTSLDLAAMEKIMARLALKLATRRSRRLTPTRSRGVVDLRRSFRRTLGSGGELLSLARRSRRIEEPRLVLLCDTSGSMDPHTRFLLTFVLSLHQVARRAEVFAFNTSLTRITRWLSARKIGPTLERLAAGVPDWSGGTMIGESLTAFVNRYQTSVVDSKTIVVILSDGLDRGDPAILGRAMRSIHTRARKVIWLNPLLGDARYEPLARGMRAALPFVDHFETAHDLESLERLVPLLAA